MILLIFEGIATSGKSTIIAKLKTALASKKIAVADESQTHIPIMEKRNETHIDFFISLINKLIAGNPDVLIFDRLYLTQAFRAHVPTTAYTQVEEMLADYSVTTIFLKVADSSIAERVEKATKHRDTKWKNYLESKGQTFDEIATYYSDQQAGILNLLESSRLPYKIFETTQHDYDTVAVDILECII